MANDLKTKIYSFDLADFKNMSELRAFGKQAAQFVNRRLNALQKEGLLSNATSGGVKKIDVRRIRNKAQAVRAVSKARQLLANPLSTPGQVKRLLRQARDQYGSSGQRMKFITVEEKVYDEFGNWTGATKLVPKAVPWGTEKGATPWYKASQQIKSFWNWYHDEMEQWLSSDEAQQMWEASGYNAKAAKMMSAEQSIAQRTADEINQVFGDQISKVSRWLD